MSTRRPYIGFQKAARSPLKSIQYGTVTIAINQTTGTAAITSVATANTVLLYLGETASAAGAPSNSYARITLTDATTITATRGAASASVVVIVSFCVLEFTSLKSVQYGTVTIALNASSGTAAITSVNTAKAFLSNLGQSSANVSTWSSTADLIRITLTNATTITATRIAAFGGFAIITSFCVAEFN